MISFSKEPKYYNDSEHGWFLFVVLEPIFFFFNGGKISQLSFWLRSFDFLVLHLIYSVFWFMLKSEAYLIGFLFSNLSVGL